MRRRFAEVLWLGTGIIFGAAGCSGEPVPPLAAISPPGDERPDPSGAAPLVALEVTAEAQAGETGRPSPPAQETADAAVHAMIGGLQRGHPDALWDALPASYQNDLNNLVRMSARRLNPDAWRWFLLIVGKGVVVVRSHTKNITADAASTEEDGQGQRRARAFEALATLLERISMSGPNLLDRMKTVDLGEMLRADGRRFAPDLAPLFEIIDDKLPQMLRKLLQVSVTLKESATDTAVLEMGFDETDGTEIEFVRVEGKWIPRCLAERWAGAIRDAKGAVCDVLPSETASDNFGRIFQLLAYVDFSLDASLWTAEHPGVDSDSMFSEVSPALTSSLMYVKVLRYLVDEENAKAAQEARTR
jgi:hypothetical protein